MALLTFLKRLLTTREPSPPKRPSSPLEIVEGEIELCRSRIENDRAVLQSLERQAIKAVRAGRDKTAARVLAEVRYVQSHLLAEQAALHDFEAQQTNLRSVLAR